MPRRRGARSALSLADFPIQAAQALCLRREPSQEQLRQGVEAATGGATPTPGLTGEVQPVSSSGDCRAVNARYDRDESDTHRKGSTDMPFYQSQGEIPHKRHTQLRGPDGRLRFEEL